MNIIELMNWRYATKKFDPTKKISDSDLEIIKEATNLAATSYGLQLYKVLIVENPEIREKLKPASWNQTQITEASHLLVFANQTNVSDEHIDGYLQLKSEVQNLDVENLKGYGDFMKGQLTHMESDKVSIWTAKQTYIALGNTMNACAALEIDSCPIEGFDAKQYNEILGLDSRNLNAAVVLPIGYRSAEDQSQFAAKVRKPLSDLFEVI